MTVLPGFDRIRIINLPSRTDRRAQMRDELRRLGLEDDPRVAFVDGVVADTAAPFRTRGERGVFLAQLNILTDAAAAEESVLILEDDVDFTPAAASWDRAPDCDIAYGGYLASDPAHRDTSDIIGAHCMGFSARAVQALVPFLTGLLETDSPPPIDGAYVWFRRQNPKFTVAFADPVVAEQRSSRSDIAAHRFFDDVPLLRETAQSARQFKRAITRGRWTYGLREAIVMSLLGLVIGAVVAYYHVAR